MYKVASSFKYTAYAFLLLCLLSCSNDSKTSSSQNSYSLSGSVTVKKQTTLDGDVIERNTAFIDSNNSVESAQSITNPITLGGYINGRLIEYLEDEVVFSVDALDVFSVSLLQSQTISLSAYYADDDNVDNNIDITLNLTQIVDEESNVVESASLNSIGAISLSVPESGQYYLELSASSESYPALYVLSLSDSLSLEDSVLLNRALKEDFVPNQVLMGAKDSVETFKASSKRSTETRIKLKKSIGSGAKLYEFNKGSSSNTFKTASSFSSSFGNKVGEKWSTLQNIEQLKKDYPEYYVEPNYIRKAAFVPNDVEFSGQWNLSMINAPEAWDVTTGSSSVIVAIIDSGIDPDHLDFRGKISPLGFDFVSESSLAGDGNGLDSDPTDLSTTKHGSHVAGIIGASTNNNIGIASVGYNTTLLPLRVLGVENEDGESTGNDADIADAIYYAAGLSNNSGRVLNTDSSKGPVEAASIINLSLGSAAESNTLKNAINAALAENVVVVAASGNDGVEQGFYPAAYEGVIAVGAVTSQGERASFSNYGNYLDVVAPGGASSDQDFNAGEQGILSTVGSSSYAEYIGTSMAAPHVSGTIALMKSINPELNNNAILSAIQNGLITDQIGQSVFFGGGLINAEKAVSWALDPSSVPDELAVFPSQLSFADENTNAPLYLSNSGAGSVSITSIGTSNDSWIEIIAVEVDSNGLGEYEVRIQNAQLPSLSSSNIQIRYSINNGEVQTIEVPVIASKTVVSNQNVGNLFVSLYSEKAFEEAVTSGILYSDYVVSASLVNGVYEYNFSSVIEKNYYMRASTNNDGDRYLFDKGEAVGRYPNLSKFDFITVNKNTTDMDFEVQFLEQNISSQGLNSIGVGDQKSLLMRQ